MSSEVKIDKSRNTYFVFGETIYVGENRGVELKSEIKSNLKRLDLLFREKDQLLMVLMEKGKSIDYNFL